MKTQKQLRDGRIDCRARKGLGSNKSKDLSVTDGEAEVLRRKGLDQTLDQIVCSQGPSWPPHLSVFQKTAKFYNKWIERITCG